MDENLDKQKKEIINEAELLTSNCAFAKDYKIGSFITYSYHSPFPSMMFAKVISKEEYLARMGEKREIQKEEGHITILFCESVVGDEVYQQMIGSDFPHLNPTPISKKNLLDLLSKIEEEVEKSKLFLNK